MFDRINRIYRIGEEEYSHARSIRLRRIFAQDPKDPKGGGIGRYSRIGTRERSVFRVKVGKEEEINHRAHKEHRGGRRGIDYEKHGKHERGEERLIEDNSPYRVRGFQARAGECAPFREVSKRL